MNQATPSKRAPRETAKRILRRLFELGQRAGFDVLPRHFYSQIPSIAELRQQRGWRQPRDMRAVRGSEISDQVSVLNSWCQPAVVEKLPPGLYETACAENGAVGFGPVEAQVLYCFIASRRPRRVVQIGCGVSTAVILRACADIGHAAELVCVDPFPTRFLVDAADSGRVELLREEAQRVGFEQLSGLDGGDLFFVDSTHTVKAGSEVNRIVLDVLPWLPDDAFVHFHDIVFPYDYSPTILSGDLFFWTETALLHAFLTNNARYALRVSLSMLHHAAPEDLQALFPTYRPAPFEQGLMVGELEGVHFPSSLYLQVLGTG